MAKAPRPGFSKTRLVPPLSHDQAASLSAAFLRDTTENIALAARQAPIQGYVAYAPAGMEALFDGHVADATPLLLADGSGEMPPGVQGFGRCLLHAARDLLGRGYAAACVLNADGPTLPTAILIQAARLLSDPVDRAVFGPSEDGGYYFLGLKAARAELFAGIDWSTDAVAAQTRARAAAIGLDMVELPPWYDIDDGTALDRLLQGPRAAGPGAYAAPATRACIDRLGIGRMRQAAV